MDEIKPWVYEFGPFSLDVAARHLLRGGRRVRIAVKTFDILLLLVQYRGRLVTKEALMSAVWPDQFVEESNLTVRVSTLRKALGEKPGEHKYVETVPGRGYRFIANVKELSAEGGREVGGRLVGSTRKKSTSGWTGGVMCLAVLPFVNENVDPNTEYLSEGIAEGIIDSLSLLPSLKVMAWAATYRYKGQEVNPYSVGRELSVNAVLVGRLLLDGDTVVVSAELMSVEDQSHIWGARYQRRLSDLFYLQEEIASEISDSLRLRLVGEERRGLQGRSSYNPDAYLLYLKGRYFWNKRSFQGITKAVKYFQQAIDLDPRYELAQAGLADSYIRLADYGVLPPGETFPKARAAIVRALAIDDELAEAHVSQAKIMSRYDWDWGGAEREYRRAIELNPEYMHARQVYADYLAKVGRFTEALLEIKKAQRLDPLSRGTNRLVALILYLSRQYEKAIEQCLETLEMDSKFVPAYGPLGLSYVGLGMYEEAIVVFERLVSFTEDQFPAARGKESAPRPTQQEGRLEPDPESLSFLAYAYTKAKHREQAVDILNRLIKLSERRYVEPHTIALVYTGLADKELAFKWLERAYAERSYPLTYSGVWPAFDDLRSDRRFADLLRRVGLAP